MHKTAPALIVLALLTFVATLAARQGPAQDKTSVKQVMLTMTIPASDVIFTAASEPPKDEHGWQDVRKSTLVLTESGELLLTGRLAKDNATWMEMARAMIAQANVTLKAIDAKDLDALAQAADDMYVTCKACHDRYME
ncbi:MAG: cytochrome c [Acidobacteria bacterium]|nr:cytochrome c [Acidobacteriota bacterium]